MPFILVSPQGQFVEVEHAKRMGLKQYHPKPGELIPGTKAYVDHQYAQARMKHRAAQAPRPAAAPPAAPVVPPLPAAPLAGFIEPKFMSSHEKAAETAKLQGWVSRARKRGDLTTSQKREVEVLTDRLRYIERGFR